MPPDYTVTNFWALLMLKGLLRQEGFTVGRLHVATLMKTMGIEAIYRRPNTSKPHPEHKIYPYLLRNMAITRPNQVWVMGITYVPPLGDCMQSPAGQRMRRGFVYLAAVIDWFIRSKGRAQHQFSHLNLGIHSLQTAIFGQGVDVIN